MGVSGLLPLLKSIQRHTELKKCSGQTLGVDSYVWLHKAAYSCATELGTGKPTTKYVNAFLHRVKMLQHFGVTPYLIFDGDYLPSKAATEDSRAKKRAEKTKLANDLLKAGKASLATQEFQKCIDITPEMASTVIQQLKKMNVQYIVAPYEADAQLVYLERKGVIDGIISDDSDLLVFGAKRLLTKMDQYGNCIEINRRDFCACREVSLTGWTDADFRRMAIMSGCDYLNGLPGVGLKTAYRLLRKSKTPERVVKLLQFDGKRISENYLTQFYQAELTFLHQWVFCPERKELVHLTDLDGARTAEEMPFIGCHVEPVLARAIAAGDINPISKEPILITMTPSKRRHSSSKPSLPTQTPNKPINSYFKGHMRVPMGEMDPNCFSVDSERVAQLTDGGLVPRVFPLPRPYIDNATDATSARPSTSPRFHRRRTEPLVEMLSRVSSSPLLSRTVSSPAEKAMSRLTPRTEPPARPSKKARLCTETDATDKSPEKSKFFAQKPQLKSPRRSKSEAYLLSDDSVEEALRNLPEWDEWTPSQSRRQAMTIFDEGASQEREQQSTKVSTQIAEVSTSGNSQLPVIEETTLESCVGGSKAALTSIIPSTQSSATPSQSSLSRFSFSSKYADTPSSLMSQQSSIFSVASTPSTAPSTARSRLTPLQRLGANVFNTSSRSPHMPARSSLQAYAFASKMPPSTHKSKLPLNPSFVPLPRVDLDEVEALHRPYGGSEDQIIPDSDGEADYDTNAKLPSPKKLDLSQFAFNEG